MPTDFLSVFAALWSAKVRYVLVGGLAVLLHGVDRLTADIDLVVDLAPAEASRAVDTLLSIGFKAGAPVDLFADYPMEFEKLYGGSVLMPLTGTAVRVASIDHLIDIKRAAGRPKDIEDAARLAGLRRKVKL